MVVNNPNNWHWVDKNCIDWTKQYFTDKLVNYTIDEQQNQIKITKIKELNGDVEVCQRKGKVISLFDFNLVMTIRCNDQLDGSIAIPEVMYDSEIDDYQFEISLDGGSLNEIDDLKKIIRNKLVPELRKIMNQFGDDLIASQASDIQISKDKVNSKYTSANQEISTKPKAQSSTFINKSTTLSSTTTTTKIDSSKEQQKSLYNTTSIKISSTFNTSAEQLYITLLDPQRVAAWTRSPPIIEAKEGSEFQLFGGNIQGKILKLVSNESISMLWRLNDWKPGHYTNLNIDLKQNDSDTTMNVSFDGVPIGEEDKVRENFENYYFKSIKITFGFGAVL